MSSKPSDDTIENIVESIEHNLYRLNRRECDLLSDDEVKSWVQIYAPPNEDFGTSKNIRSRHFVSTFHHF